MTELRVVQDTFEHLLSFVVRFDDHFLGGPVTEELQLNTVSPANAMILPVTAQAGGFRQPDGTYRFRDLRPGSYPIQFASLTGSWTSWDPPLTVTAPLASPAKPVARDLWPTANAPVAPGMTAIRGKLLGANVGRLKVEVTPKGAAFSGRFNMSDAAGEFLIPFPVRVKPEKDGRIKLTIRVANGARTVGTITVLDGMPPPAPPVVAPDFVIVPGRATRVKFSVT